MENNMDYDKQQQVYVDDVPHVLSWGGLHGAINNYIDEGLFLSLDVASFYPAIMIEYDFLSRNVSEKNKYREIRDERIRLKNLKDAMQQPYKIVLNSTYGASKDKYNALYDPLMANNVCVAGQLLLLDLIECLEGHWKLCQSNTDGLIGKVDSMEQIEYIKKICNEWEQRTRMVLEYDVYSKLIQKDVNNYIIVNDAGKYKSKGAYVKKLSPIDYDLAIVNKAIVDYFIHSKPVADTITQCSRLIEFQKVVKISHKFDGAVFGNEPLGRCFRVFASLESTSCIRKLKGDSKHKIANVPENCFINNGNIVNARVPRRLDKQWYINLANERIKDFEGEDLPYDE